MFKMFVVMAAVSAAACVMACSSDDDDHSHDTTTGDHESDFPSCQVIMEACHPLDVGEGPIHDCHEVAHESTSDAPCAAKKDECLKTCVADAGAAADSGASDASNDQ